MPTSDLLSTLLLNCKKPILPQSRHHLAFELGTVSLGIGRRQRARCIKRPLRRRAASK
jgi:hypothetical protein